MCIRDSIDPAAHTRHDAINDLQEMAVVTKHRIRFQQQTTAFDEYPVLAVHEYVGDGQIAEQRFQRTQTEDLIEQIGLDLLLFVKACLLYTSRCV